MSSHHRHHRIPILAAVVALAVSACSSPAPAPETTTTTPAATTTIAEPTTATAAPTVSDGVREVTIVMTEFAFEPDSLDVTPGETIAITFVNEGVIEHEARLDTVHGVDDHIAGGHEGHEHGDGPLAVLVAAGESETLRVTFGDDADFELIACTLPGHYEAGMFAELHGLDAVSASGEHEGDHEHEDEHGHATGEVTVFDGAELEAVAKQAQAAAVLTAIDFVDTAGFHGMSEALEEGEFTGREAGAVEKVMTAMTAIAWPHELEEIGAAFLADLEALHEALEAEDVEGSAAAAHTVHESQHDFSHDVYAFLNSDTAGHDH